MYHKGRLHCSLCTCPLHVTPPPLRSLSHAISFVWSVPEGAGSSQVRLAASSRALREALQQLGPETFPGLPGLFAGACSALLFALLSALLSVKVSLLFVAISTYSGTSYLEYSLQSQLFGACCRRCYTLPAVSSAACCLLCLRCECVPSLQVRYLASCIHISEPHSPP